ncbi:hypothetical protein GCM10010361_33950 [Streptomyces olivaceiscleroticus]|uniref:AB hydrolase-1 domain-containing protein n=2 Tax=Streptomyces olivaceiscleroticus TaxID=68245 RepID=A0ABN1A470_9ACTN
MVASKPVHLVFVHGLFSSREVWSAFQKLIDTDPVLKDWVTVDCFEYDSRRFQLRPDRRIGEIEGIADALETRLHQGERLREAESIVLVTHSQGGLIVQRFLSRMLRDGKGRDLSRIKHITMFACPNTGSAFFLSIRKFLIVWNHPQEKQLRPFERAVTEAQRTVLCDVVHARSLNDRQCPIPVAAYGGLTDNIVPDVVARGAFPSGGVIRADHRSIVQPTDHDADSYIVVRRALLDVAARGPGPADGAPAAPVPGSPFEWQSGGQSVSPPFARLEGSLKGPDRHSLIASIMASATPKRVHVLAGLGGSGKSRLALEIADRARRADRQVWWVPAAQLSSCMRTVAGELGAPEPQVRQAWGPGVGGSATDLVWRLLNAADKPWLLVLDNADDPQQLGPRDGAVSDGTGWLRDPTTDKGMVIVTSRVRSQEIWGSWSQVHRVVPLNDEDGASLLLERTGGAGGSNEQARALSAELGGLPLVLRYAADFVKAVSSGKVTLKEGDIKDFESYRKAVKLRFESAPGTPRDRDSDELFGQDIVEKVCGIALDLLAQQEMPQAAPLLKVFACLNIAPIPYRCLLNGEALAQSPLFPEFSPAQCTAVVRGLEDLGLVDVDVREGADDPEFSHVLTLHPVVHGVLREDEDVQARRTDYYGLTVRLLLTASKGKNPDHPSNWPLWEAIAPHAKEVTRSCLLGTTRLTDRSVPRDALELARLTARYLITTGLLGPARDLVLPIIDSCASFDFHEKDREILALRHEKGRIALEREDLRAAEEELRKVVEARTQVLGSEDHPGTLASRHKLARAIVEQERWEEAEPMLRSIISAENKVSGPEHYDTLVVRHTLARAMSYIPGRAAEAENEVRKILAVSRRRDWPATTPETLRVRATLARCMLVQGRGKEAEEEIRGALRDAAQPMDTHLMLHLRYVLCLVLLRRGRAPDSVRELSALQGDLNKVNPAGPLTKKTSRLLEKAVQQMSDPDQYRPNER